MYLMEGSVARLTRTDLTANVAPSGAGARVVRSATLVVVGGVVARNNATADGGGGILCDGGEVTLANVRVEENTCNTLGGGLSLGGGCVANVGEGATFARNAAGRFVGERCHFEGAAGGRRDSTKRRCHRTPNHTHRDRVRVRGECRRGRRCRVQTEAAAFAANAAAAPRRGRHRREEAAGCPRRCGTSSSASSHAVPLPPKVAATAEVCTPPRA